MEVIADDVVAITLAKTGFADITLSVRAAIAVGSTKYAGAHDKPELFRQVGDRSERC